MKKTNPIYNQLKAVRLERRYLIYVYVLSIVILLFTNCNSNGHESTPQYKYVGTFENDSNMKTQRADYYFREEYTKELRIKLEQGKFENGSEMPAVPNAETAFYIAKKIMINKFGSEDVEKDYPFKIYLVDNYEWRIIGSSKGRMRFGDSNITCSICKLDGRLLGCYHEKK